MSVVQFLERFDRPKPLMSTNRVKPVCNKHLLKEKIKTKPKPLSGVIRLARSALFCATSIFHAGLIFL